jgi:hypothetical protein
MRFCCVSLHYLVDSSVDTSSGLLVELCKVGVGFRKSRLYENVEVIALFVQLCSIDPVMAIGRMIEFVTLRLLQEIGVRDDAADTALALGERTVGVL